LDASFRIGDEAVLPGQRRVIELPLPSLYGHARLTMPVHVLRGRRPGPTLLVSAAVHGDEINGVEIARRLLGMRMLGRLRGTLLCVPVVNVYGFVNRSRYMPDRRDLNRAFPGSERGSTTARLAHLFLDQVARWATHLVDLHTAAVYRTNLPQVRAHLKDEVTQRMATAFGSPVILDSNLLEGSLRAEAANLGIPMLLFEGGEALRFEEIVVRAGLRGVLEVMRTLEMLPARRRARPGPAPVVARSSIWIRAPRSGVLRTSMALGTHVRSGDVLGIIGDPLGDDAEEVDSTVDGILIGRVTLPLVNEGEALFHVAKFRDPRAVGEQLEVYHEALSDSDHLADSGPGVTDSEDSGF